MAAETAFQGPMVPIPANRSPAGLCLSGYTVKATDARSAIIETLDTAKEGRGKHADGKGRICPPSRGNIGETPQGSRVFNTGASSPWLSQPGLTFSA